MRHKLGELRLETSINERWSMRFISDALENSRKILTINAIDDDNRKGLRFDADFPVPSQHGIRQLEQIRRIEVSLPPSDAIMVL